MAAADHLSPAQFVPPITAGEARGDSRPVGISEYQHLAAEGRHYVQGTKRKTSTAGLDRDWGHIKKRAFKEAQRPWGGATINSYSGEFVGSGQDYGETEAKAKGRGYAGDRYALTAKHPGQQTVEVPEHINQEQFGAAMDKARRAFPQLQQRGHHLGVFHDNEKHTIDIDPVIVVRTKHDVETVGAYTHATGGAYHFNTGQGHYPPHVKS